MVTATKDWLQKKHKNTLWTVKSCPKARWWTDEPLYKYLLNKSTSRLPLCSRSLSMPGVALLQPQILRAGRYLADHRADLWSQGAPLISQTVLFCSRREPTEKFPRVHLPRCHYKGLSLLSSSSCHQPRSRWNTFRARRSPWVWCRVPVRRVAVTGSSFGSRPWRERSCWVSSQCPEWGGSRGWHFLVHLPRGVPVKMCLCGEGTSF